MAEACYQSGNRRLIHTSTIRSLCDADEDRQIPRLGILHGSKLSDKDRAFIAPLVVQVILLRGQNLLIFGGA